MLLLGRKQTTRLTERLHRRHDLSYSDHWQQTEISMKHQETKNVLATVASPAQSAEVRKSGRPTVREGHHVITSGLIRCHPPLRTCMDQMS